MMFNKEAPIENVREKAFEDELVPIQ